MKEKIRPIDWQSRLDAKAKMFLSIALINLMLGAPSLACSSEGGLFRTFTPGINSRNQTAAAENREATATAGAIDWKTVQATLMTGATETQKAHKSTLTAIAPPPGATIPPTPTPK